jgi:hypothetical protein
MVSPLLYVGSYFLFGAHRTGTEYRRAGLTSKSYTYHDREFPFDPWIYKPLALVEYRIRGSDSQVVIVDGSNRSGQAIYGYGPFR